MEVDLPSYSVDRPALEEWESDYTNVLVITVVLSNLCSPEIGFFGKMGKVDLK